MTTIARIAQTAFAALAIAASASIPCKAQTGGCTNYTCAPGNVCFCEDCTACNSGSFQVGCQCHPVQGQTICGGQTGDCKLEHCAECTSTTNGRTCWTYVGCPGQTCPASGCSPGPAVAYSRKIVASGWSDSPAIDLFVPDNVPLDIVDLDYVLGKNSFNLSSYTVTNRSANPLIALVTTWTFTGGDAAHPQSRTITKVIDSWETAGGFVPAGGRDKMETPVNVSGDAIRQIAITVTYAEFDNGDRFGPSPDCTYASLFANRRSEILQGYRAVLAKYRSGAPPQDVDRFASQQPSLTWLKLIRGQRGFQFMIEQLERPRSIRSN